MSSTNPACEPHGRPAHRAPGPGGRGFLLPFVALFLFVFVIPLGFAIYESLLKRSAPGRSAWAGHRRLRRAGQLRPRAPAVGLPGRLRAGAALRHRADPGDAAAGHRAGAGARHALPALGGLPARRLLPAVRRPRCHRLDPVGLPLRTGRQPPGRPARQGRSRARLPRLPQRAVVHRQHRDLGVHRLQHAGDRRPAQVDPAGALRGRAHRRRQRLADGGPDQAAAGPARPRAHRRLHHHRHPAAVRRTPGHQAADHVDHQFVHPEPGRLQRGVHQQQHLPRRGRVGDPRAGRERAVLRLPQPGEPQGKRVHGERVHTPDEEAVAASAPAPRAAGDGRDGRPAPG